MRLKDKTNAWLQLIRLPNLFTIPGEAIVGGLLSGVDLNTAAIAGLSFLLIYMGGLIHNDIVDLDEDRQERKERPLPSGIISISQAIWATSLCYIFGLLIAFLLDGPGAFFLFAVLITVLSLVYNLVARRIAPLGWSAIALCRALIPVSMFWMVDYQSHIPLIYAGGIYFYIWLIAAAAHNETSGGPSFPIDIFLPMIVLLCLIGLNHYAQVPNYHLFWGAPAIVLVFHFSHKMRTTQEPESVQMYIGKSIGAVLLFQGASLLVTGRLLGLLLWALYPVSGFTAKKYKGS